MCDSKIFHVFRFMYILAVLYPPSSNLQKMQSLINFHACIYWLLFLRFRFFVTGSLLLVLSLTINKFIRLHVRARAHLLVGRKKYVPSNMILPQQQLGTRLKTSPPKMFPCYHGLIRSIASHWLTKPRWWFCIWAMVKAWRPLHTQTFKSVLYFLSITVLPVKF
jgi:hypothetical protein